MTEVDIEKISIGKLLKMININQLYRLLFVLVTWSVAWFGSGYATSEHFHKEEKYKIEMLDAIVQVWQAQTRLAKADRVSGGRFHGLAIVSPMPRVSKEYIEYQDAKKRFDRAIQQQHVIQEPLYDVEEAEEGTWVKSRSGKRDYWVPKYKEDAGPELPRPMPTPKPLIAEEVQEEVQDDLEQLPPDSEAETEGLHFVSGMEYIFIVFPLLLLPLLVMFLWDDEEAPPSAES